MIHSTHLRLSYSLQGKLGIFLHFKHFFSFHFLSLDGERPDVHPVPPVLTGDAGVGARHDLKHVGLGLGDGRVVADDVSQGTSLKENNR